MGAAAVAFLVTDGASVTVHDRGRVRRRVRGRTLPDAHSNRVESLGVTSYERVAVRESVGTVVEDLNVTAEALAGATLHQPNAGLPYRVRGDVQTDAVARGTGWVTQRHLVSLSRGRLTPHRISTQLTDCDPETVRIGDTVHATVRRVYADEGVPRYGAKVTPIE